jgi:signal transduction histidine kinase
MNKTTHNRKDSFFELVKTPQLLDLFSIPAAIIKGDNIFYMNDYFINLIGSTNSNNDLKTVNHLFNINATDSLHTLNKLNKHIRFKKEFTEESIIISGKYDKPIECLSNLKHIKEDYFLFEINPDSNQKNYTNSFNSSIIKNLNMACCIVDKDLRIVENNKSFAKIFSITDNISGLKTEEVLPFDIIGELNKANYAIMNNSSEYYDFETEIIWPDSNQIIFVKIEVCKLDDSEKLLLTVTDQSHEVELLKKLTQAEERAKHLKNVFVAQVSHEIRTPISAMLSFANLLKDELRDYITPDIETGFNIIRRGGERIVRTINLILDTSEVMTNTYEYIPDEFDLLTEVVSDVFLKYKKLAKERDLYCSLTSSAITHNVFCDFYMVQQILSNILDNAVKFTSDGGIKVKLYSDSSNELCIEVSDTGIGISKEYLSNIFEPFSQEDEGENRSYEGNGLGLTLSKTYCDINNIDIKIFNNASKGTTVKLKFNTTVQSSDDNYKKRAINL